MLADPETYHAEAPDSSSVHLSLLAEQHATKSISSQFRSDVNSANPDNSADNSAMISDIFHRLSHFSGISGIISCILLAK